jgi:hypothetical protein
VKSRKYPKTCAFCLKDFLGYRKNSKYCSDVCRYAWTARHYTEQQLKRKQEYQKKWGTVNWLRRRNYMLMYTYGITPEQYQELLEKQNYSCACCGRHETEFARKLAIDHDHSTGEIFGLLCRDCNHTLIGRYRNSNIFLAAAKYLNKGTGWFIPIKEEKHGRSRLAQNAKRKRRARRNVQ